MSTLWDPLSLWSIKLGPRDTLRHLQNRQDLFRFVPSKTMEPPLLRLPGWQLNKEQELRLSKELGLRLPELLLRKLLELLLNKELLKKLQDWLQNRLLPSRP